MTTETVGGSILVRISKSLNYGKKTLRISRCTRKPDVFVCVLHPPEGLGAGSGSRRFPKHAFACERPQDPPPVTERLQIRGSGDAVELNAGYLCDAKASPGCADNQLGLNFEPV